MCQTLKGQKVCIFEGPVWGKLFFIFAYPKNVMCLACVVKKFEFGESRWGNLPFWYPQILSNFIIPLY